MEHDFIYFIYGLCCMFYSMMAWLFWRNRQSRLSKFVMALMLLIAVQSIKDVFFLIVDCLYINIDVESVYLLGSLVMWMFLCYFIYRHESVISELKASVPEETSIQPSPADSTPDMSQKILRLFEEQQIYLNPNLKLSDIASMVGSNRTYVSRFFNAEQNSTFFDFVNGYRVRMATSLLRETDEKIEVIAERVGFNSRQAFHRVFSKTIGQTPEKFRSGNRSNSVSAR